MYRNNFMVENVRVPYFRDKFYKFFNNKNFQIYVRNTPFQVFGETFGK